MLALWCRLEIYVAIKVALTTTGSCWGSRSCSTLLRALGTVAAERADRRGWACACAIVGSPVVAWVALFRRPGDRLEPAPLAGLVSLAAARVAVLGRHWQLGAPTHSARTLRDRYSQRVDPEPGEEVFFHGHPSWRSMLGFYVRGLLVAIVAGVIAGFVTRLANARRAAGWVAPRSCWSFLIVLLVG